MFLVSLLPRHPVVLLEWAVVIWKTRQWGGKFWNLRKCKLQWHMSACRHVDNARHADCRDRVYLLLPWPLPSACGLRPWENLLNWLQQQRRRRRKHRKSAKLSWRRNIKLSFWSLSFCLFCLFFFLSFCLSVFWSFCLNITLIECLKGLKSQQSLFVLKF